MKLSHSRRDFLRISAFLSGSALLPSVPVLGANEFWHTPTREPQHVLILGAGMAGMSAAMELQALGHQVTILEGQTRAGGRVKTLRSPLASGLYADLGAARIPENHDWTMKYIKKYGLKTELFNAPTGNYLHFMRGKRIPYTATTPASLRDYPAKLTSKEYEMNWNGITTTPFDPIMSRLGDATDLSWPPEEIKKYDGYTFKEFLIDQGYSKEIADILFIGWETDKGINMSVLESMREFTLSFGAPRLKVVGGNDLIASNMARELGDIIHYGIKVVDFSQDDSGVSVVYDKAGKSQVLTADHLICTFPLPVLKKMDAIKSLSAEKQKAIEEYGYWDLSRTIIQVKDRYWKKEGFNGFAATDKPSEIWDPLYEAEGTRGLIANYIKDDASQLLHEMSESDRLEYSVSHVNEVFPGLYDVVEGGHTKCWGEDPWSLGAHSIGERGQMTRLLQALLKPEGRIYLAGEHSSAYHGWIQGALESGARAAKQIHEQ